MLFTLESQFSFSEIFLKDWIILHMFPIKEKNVVSQYEKADLISINV